MDKNLQIKYSQLLAKMSFIPLWGIAAGVLGIIYGTKANNKKAVRLGSFGLVFNLILAIGAIYFASNNQDFASRLYPAIIGSLMLLFLSISIGLIISLVMKNKLKNN